MLYNTQAERHANLSGLSTTHRPNTQGEHVNLSGRATTHKPNDMSTFLDTLEHIS